jgi:hypothetical protein
MLNAAKRLHSNPLAFVGSGDYGSLQIGCAGDHCELLQLRVVSLGLLQDGDVEFGQINGFVEYRRELP